MLPGADIGVLRAAGRGNTALSPSVIAAPVPGYAHFDPANTVHAKGDVNDVHEQMHPTRGAERAHGNTSGKTLDAEIGLQGRNVSVLAHGPSRVRVDQDSQDLDQQVPGQRPPKQTRQETDEVRILAGNAIGLSALGAFQFYIVTLLTLRWRATCLSRALKFRSPQFLPPLLCNRSTRIQHSTAFFQSLGILLV